MLIRPETQDEAAVIAEIHTSAFGQGDPVGKIPDEVGLVAALRRSDAWLPSLSLVAEIEGRVVGHCLTTRAHVLAEQVLALGPIGVDAAWQRRGIGSALTEATIESANTHGEMLIGLVGDPRFYGRFGFVPSSEVHITPPDASWGRYFQIRTLDAYRSDVVGEFRYPSPFDDL